MAAHRVCGCGRRVRFGRKRSSSHGAEVRKLLGGLEAIAVPIADARGSATQRDQLTRLISDGRELERLFREMAHGEPVAPPPMSGISGWFRDANRVAQAFQVPRPEPVEDARHSDHTPGHSGSLDQLTNDLWAKTLELLEVAPDGSMTGERIRLSAVTLACAVALPPSPDHDCGSRRSHHRIPHQARRDTAMQREAA